MLIRPKIFSKFPEIVAAQSTRECGASPMPFGLNLSSHVGDDPVFVAENRKRFYATAGVPEAAQFVYQNQVHSASINAVKGSEGVVKESDGLLTDEANVFLCVSVADCTPVLIYAPDKKLIAAVHAGWRGTEQLIAFTMIKRLTELGADPELMHAFIGASASVDKYEVGTEVATLFEKDYYRELPNGKCLLDVKKANRDQLLIGGVPQPQIEISPLCSISDERLHSYRRDGKQSGRMFAVIGRVGDG